MSFWVAGAALVGTAVMSSQAEDAEDAQYAATQQSNATQKAMYDQTRTDNMPALDTRNAALTRMRELLGISDNTGSAGFGTLGGRINPGDVTGEPGYQFGMQEGQRALNAQLNARGMRNSGAALKAAARYGTDYGTTKYDQSFNREVANRSAVLNPLQSAAGLGQTGASTIANAGLGSAGVISGNQTGMGNALGASRIAQGNALSGGINQAAGWYANQNRGGGADFGNWSNNPNYGLNNSVTQSAFDYGQYRGGTNDGY